MRQDATGIEALELRCSSGKSRLEAAGRQVLPMILFLILWLPAVLAAEEVPSYQEARILAQKSWKDRFPAEALSLREVSGGRRLLFARVQGVPVYYYRFLADLPRLYRAADESIEQEEVAARTVEVWFRYQPQLKQGDFAFVRDDLLPGTDRRWLE
jgi:hypothetical protein